MSRAYNFKRKTLLDFIVVSVLQLRFWNKNKYLERRTFSKEMDTYILRFFRQKNLRITNPKRIKITSHESCLDGSYGFGKVCVEFDSDGDLKRIDVDGFPYNLWVRKSTANYIRYKVVRAMKDMSNKKDEELKEKLESAMAESVLEMSGL